MLALKENQGTLYQDVVLAFQEGLDTSFRAVAHDSCQTTSSGHGCLEIRRCWTISDPEYLRYLSRDERWPALRSIAMVEAERRVGKQVTGERRYYISSLPGEAKAIAHAIRSHWGIENSLHWVLDIAFDEDRCRVRSGHADANLAVLRHIALNLLKQETRCTRGIKGKRLKAAWNTNYLLRVLGA